jgi:cystathionine beta-lyase
MTSRARQLFCLPDDVLRQRSGIKWSRAGPGELPADFAELDFSVAAPVRQALLRSNKLSDFGYPDFDQGTPVVLKELFSERMRQQHGWVPPPERTELSGQIAQALCCVILTLTEPGDVVLTHAPTYPPFLTAIRDLGRQLVTVPVGDVDNAPQLMSMLPTITQPVRLILLCHPHNPTGHVFAASTLSAVATLANAHNAVVFSDEIYQDLVFAPSVYRPAALTPGLGDRTITFTSAAKSFNIPGLRCAVGHFGSARLHNAYIKLPGHLRDGASIVGVAATLAAWRHGEAWLAELRRTLGDNRELVATGMGRLHGVTWTPPAAGFLAWLNFIGSSVASDPHTVLRRRARVILQAGSAFGSTFAYHARLNFGTSGERLARILDRVAHALDLEP